MTEENKDFTVVIGEDAFASLPELAPSEKDAIVQAFKDKIKGLGLKDIQEMGTEIDMVALKDSDPKAYEALLAATSELGEGKVYYLNIPEEDTLAITGEQFWDAVKLLKEGEISTIILEDIPEHVKYKGTPWRIGDSVTYKGHTGVVKSQVLFPPFDLRGLVQIDNLIEATEENQLYKLHVLEYLPLEGFDDTQYEKRLSEKDISDMLLQDLRSKIQDALGKLSETSTDAVEELTRHMLEAEPGAVERVQQTTELLVKLRELPEDDGLHMITWENEEIPSKNGGVLFRPNQKVTVPNGPEVVIMQQIVLFHFADGAVIGSMGTHTNDEMKEEVYPFLEFVPTDRFDPNLYNAAPQ